MHELSHLNEPSEGSWTGQGGSGAASHSPCFAESLASVPCSWQTNLGRIIESEIIPRLVLCNLAACPPKPKRPLPKDPSISDLTDLVLSPDPSAAFAYVEGLQMRGTPATSILLDHLAPAARHLGTLWESDDRDFLEISIGLQRLRNLMNELAGNEIKSTPFSSSPKGLFMLAPGEVHAFGLSIVEIFFRNAGWQAYRADQKNYLGELRNDWYAVIGFSLSCERYLGDLKNAIQKARLASKNPSITVLVGGPVFVDQPDLIQTVGADASGANAAEAVLAVQALRELGLSA